MRKANLFIVGAMKSGSTSLHNYLGDHPQVFMCEPKEPWYFIKEKNWHKGEDWYQSLFSNASDDVTIIGESSADYTMAPKYEGVPERIAKYNPDSRIIYILREPVMRTISHYWHNVRWHAEQRDMIVAIKEEPFFREVSNYYMQLTNYLKVFPAEHIYVLTFEHMIHNPAIEVSKIFSWLGVRSDYIPSNITQKSNTTPKQVEMVRGTGLLHNFKNSLFWDRIHSIFPKYLKDFGNRLATKAVDRKSRSIDDVVKLLLPSQLEQVELLSELLGRKFAEWKTLNGNKN